MPPTSTMLGIRGRGNSKVKSNLINHMEAWLNISATVTSLWRTCEAMLSKGWYKILHNRGSRKLTNTLSTRWQKDMWSVFRVKNRGAKEGGLGQAVAAKSRPHGIPRSKKTKGTERCSARIAPVGTTGSVSTASNCWSRRYSSIIKQNSSWSQTAMSLTRSVRRCQDHAGRSSSRGFPAPAPESRCGQSHEAKASHTQSASLQKRTSQPWTWPDRDPGRYGRAGGGPRAQGRRRGRGWRETLSGGSENSIVISDEGTDWEASEEADGGRMTSSPIEVADAGVNALWVLEDDDDDDGFQDREHEARDRDGVISLPDVEQEVLEFGGAVEEEDHGSRCSSTASGPTLSADLALQSPCPACAKLFRKMGKLKHWEKSIEYDPTSLSCDQWVLKKIWRPRNLPNRKGELWTHLGRIRKRALSSTEAGETQQPKTSCSRPHVFLHRNLLLCKRKEALRHLRPCHTRTKVDSRRGVVQVRARESRRQKKRKLCEMGPQEEGPLHAQDTSFSSGEEVAALDVSDRSDGEGRNTACRKLFSGPSVSPDPHRQRQEPQPQKTTRQDMETDARCTSLPSAARRRSKTFKASPERGALGHCPWVRDGGFRSMLAELEGNRNLVVHELDRLSVNKLRKCV